MRKDIDEFKKQKFLIGSIIAMPIVLGIVVPLAILVPVSYAFTMDGEWDIEGFIEQETEKQITVVPITNLTFEDITRLLDNRVIQNANVKSSIINNSVFTSCIIENSTIYNSTIKDCALKNSTLENVVVSHSSGDGLKGKNILAIGSDLEFVDTKENELKDFLPMILNMILIVFIIIPATLPTLIASYSIVGEKNNKSLEPLFATPTTDGEILAGKILSSLIPTLATTYLAFIISVIIIDIIYTPILGYIPLPNLTWILAIIFLAPAVCFMSILACVFISSKVKDVRAAQQLGGFVVMPIVVIMVGVISGLILLSPYMVLVIAVMIIGLDAGLFYLAKGIFNREDILVKWT
jgi:ABC-2 type transport system permease protein